MRNDCYVYGETPSTGVKGLSDSFQYVCVQFRKASRLHWNVLSCHFLSAMLEYLCELMLQLPR